MAFLNISSKNKNGILKKIDEESYLNLDDCSRLELYSFMVALGFESGYPSDFDGAKESFVREEYIRNNNLFHAFQALYFTEHNGSIEEITETDKIFALSDKFANTGFSVIADYMKEYSPNALAMKLISDMDSKYEEYKDSFWVLPLFSLVRCQILVCFDRLILHAEEQ